MMSSKHYEWVGGDRDQRLRQLVEHRSNSNQRVVGFVLGGVESDLVSRQRICSQKCQSPQLTQTVVVEKGGK